MSGFINTTPTNFSDALSTGRSSSNPFVDVFSTRDPTSSDINYPTQKKWLNTNTQSFWVLEGFSSLGGFVSAIWIEIGPGGGITDREVAVDHSVSPGTNPVLPTVGGLITVTGAQVPAGTTVNVIRTDSLAANTYTIEVQRSQAVASSTVGDNGVCHFNSADFTVDSDGFVSSLGFPGTTEFSLDANTPPGTNPVVPNGSGNVTISGGQVAAGTTPNVIRTDSLAANAYTIEVQRSQAVASSTIGTNGVCHFDSADFTVDANGFVRTNGRSIKWQTILASQTIIKNNGYICISPGGALSLALPSTSSSTIGDLIEIVLDGATSWTISQDVGQQIQFSSSQTTSGGGGSISSTSIGDTIELVYQGSGRWNAISAIGSLTVT